MSNPNKTSQFELFPGSADYVGEVHNQQNRLNKCTVTFDKILIVGICIIMTMVLSFSLGVERGKKITKQSIQFERQKVVASPRADESTAVEKQDGSVAESRIVPAFQTPAGSEEPLDNALMAQQDLENVYTVQVASFKKEKYAREEAVNLEKFGIQYEILVLPKGKHSIVCVGKFDEEKKAKQFSSKLRKKYKDCLVRRL